MIEIGLTDWGDHDTLYEGLERKTDKLKTYASYLPIVELDASYYAIQSERNIIKWINETPNRFQFVVKTHQALTLHVDYRDYTESRDVLFKQFKEITSPLEEHNKLAMMLAQFPPWSGCNVQSIDYVLYVRKQLTNIPMSIEFRH